jgi:MarR family transcriptional regulator, organic hydroperoxide resistance regulator
VSPARRKLPAEQVPELGEGLEFLRTLWELDHTLQTASEAMARRRGVTGQQRLVLRIVGRFPQLSPGQLAEILHLHPSTLTGILKRLQRRGLLKRRVDLADRRRSLLGLTPEGRALDVDSTHTVEGVLERLLPALPRAQTQATQRTLHALSEALALELGR